MKLVFIIKNNQLTSKKVNVWESGRHATNRKTAKRFALINFPPCTRLKVIRFIVYDDYSLRVQYFEDSIYHAYTYDWVWILIPVHPPYKHQAILDTSSITLSLIGISPLSHPSHPPSFSLSFLTRWISELRAISKINKQSFSYSFTIVRLGMRSWDDFGFVTLSTKKKLADTVW